MKEVFLTPTEIVKKYPNIPFDPQTLGRLVGLGILRGRHKDKMSLISEESVLRLIEFRNQEISKDLINIKSKT